MERFENTSYPWNPPTWTDEERVEARKFHEEMLRRAAGNGPNSEEWVQAVLNLSWNLPTQIGGVRRSREGRFHYKHGLRGRHLPVQRTSHARRGNLV